MKFLKTKYPKIIFILSFLVSTCYSEQKNSQSEKIQPEKPISVDEFLKIKEVGNFQISPDGNWLSFIKKDQNSVYNIYILKINKLDKSKKIYPSDLEKLCIKISDFNKNGIKSYFWSNNNKIILSYDSVGSENNSIHMIEFSFSKSISSDKNKTNNVPIDELIIKTSVIYQNEEYKSSVMSSSSERLLILINERNKAQMDIYEYSFKNKKMKMIFKNEMSFFGFHLDQNGKYIIMYKLNEKSEILKYIYYFKEKKIQEINAKIQDNIIVCKKNECISSINENNKLNIYSTRLNCGRSKILFSKNTKSDIYSLIISKSSGKIIGVSTYYESQKWHTRDKAKVLKKILNKYSNKIEDYVTWKIHSSDDHNKLLLVSVVTSKKPSYYILIDIKSQKITEIMTFSEEFDSYQFNKTESFIIKSSDNLDLVCYITKPYWISGPSPLIVLVHGGPESRDYLEYNGITQILSNLGYAVMQVQFRGSSGFGKEFLEAGYGEWGKKMHQDIMDCVKWAIKNKITQKGKIAIMGGSYGGYETLFALTQSKMFSCGISLCGISNLSTLINSIPDYWVAILPHIWKMILNVKFEDSNSKMLEKYKSKLEKISPINYKIKHKLLLIHGKEDIRTREQESNSIAKNTDKVFYIQFMNEGHGIQHHENIKIMLMTIQVFLYYTFKFKENNFSDELIKQYLNEIYKSKNGIIAKNTIIKSCG